MSFQNYPLAMSHPHKRPAVLSQDTVNRDGSINHAPAGKPAAFPDVFVSNKDQELQYASMGYLPNGVSDPDAYMSAVLGADKPFSHEHVEYPKWLYQADEDGDVDSVLIDSEAQEKKLSGLWWSTPDEARSAQSSDDQSTQKRGRGRPSIIKSSEVGA